MEVLKKILNPIFYVLGKKKKMIFFTLFSAVFFAVLIFPYDDLSDLVMAKAADQGIFLDFDRMGLSLFPPSLHLDKVTVDTAMLPSVNAGEIYLAPNIMGILTLSPGFSASMDDFLKGSLSVDYRVGKKIKSTRLQKVDLDLSNIDLKGLSSFAQLPIDLEGRIQGRLAAEFDPSLTQQPDGNATVEIEKLHIPAVMVPAWMAMTLPDTKIAKVDLTGTLKDGRLDITKGIIGQNGDNVHGRIKGYVLMQIVKGLGGATYSNVGHYEFNLDLTLDPSIEKNFGTILSLLNFDRFKSVGPGGTRYALKLSGDGPNGTPTPSALDANAFQ